jgi:hypothetical protein
LFIIVDKSVWLLKGVLEMAPKQKKVKKIEEKKAPQWEKLVKLIEKKVSK